MPGVTVLQFVPLSVMLSQTKNSVFVFTFNWLYTCTILYILNVLLKVSNLKPNKPHINYKIPWNKCLRETINKLKFPW